LPLPLNQSSLFAFALESKQPQDQRQRTGASAPHKRVVVFIWRMAPLPSPLIFWNHEVSWGTVT
jgi:hypothetical protein